MATSHPCVPLELFEVDFTRHVDEPIGSSSDLALTVTDEMAGANWRRPLAVDYARYEGVRAGLVDALTRISSGSVAARRQRLASTRRQLGPVISKQLDKLVVVVLPEFRGDRLILDPRPFIPDIETACAYAIALLLDSTRPTGDKRTFGERLRRCALGADEGEACGKWFLSFENESGGPMPKYCCSEHRFAAGAATGGDRVKRHRAHRAAKHK
jgi:hypothetical protein